MKSLMKVKKIRNMHKNEVVTAYFMVAPALIMLGFFVIAPLLMAFQKSFTDWTFYTESVFVGLKNFKVILGTVYFRKAVVNSFKFVLLIVPLMLLMCFLFSNLLINLSKGFSDFVKTTIYVPGIISGVVTSVIFIFVMDYRAGLLNQILMIFGLQRIPFLAHPLWSTISIVMPSIWLGIGGGTILMYAGLMNVPIEFYEAASIDGAGWLKKLISITMPQMKNIFVLMCINMTTMTLQMFELPYLMTNGGPRNTTLVPMLYLYNNFRDFDKTMGYTIAGALLMMVVIASINSFVFTVIKSEKTIDG